MKWRDWKDEEVRFKKVKWKIGSSENQKSEMNILKDKVKSDMKCKMNGSKRWNGGIQKCKCWKWNGEIKKMKRWSYKIENVKQRGKWWNPKKQMFSWNEKIEKIKSYDEIEKINEEILKWRLEKVVWKY